MCLYGAGWACPGGGGRDLDRSAAVSESSNPDKHTGAGPPASVSLDSSLISSTGSRWGSVSNGRTGMNRPVEPEPSSRSGPGLPQGAPGNLQDPGYLAAQRVGQLILARFTKQNIINSDLIKYFLCHILIYHYKIYQRILAHSSPNGHVGPKTMQNHKIVRIWCWSLNNRSEFLMPTRAPELDRVYILDTPLHMWTWKLRNIHISISTNDNLRLSCPRQVPSARFMITTRFTSACGSRCQYEIFWRTSVCHKGVYLWRIRWFYDFMSWQRFFLWGWFENLCLNVLFLGG